MKGISSHFKCIWFPFSVVIVIVLVVGNGGKIEGFDALYCADETILTGVKAFLEHPWIEGMMQKVFETWGLNVHVIWEHLIRLEDIASSKEAETLRFFCAKPISRWGRALDFNTETKKGHSLELFVQTFAALKLSAFLGHPDLCEGVNRCYMDKSKGLTASTKDFLEMDALAKMLLTPLVNPPTSKHPSKLNTLQKQKIPEGGIKLEEGEIILPFPRKDEDTTFKNEMRAELKQIGSRLDTIEASLKARGFLPPDGTAFLEKDKKTMDNNNSLRTVQWILKRPTATAFFDWLWNDKNAETLEKAANEDGIFVEGAFAFIITGNQRGLCAFEAAASLFTKGLLENNENKGLMEKAEFYYISGFFLTVSPESSLKVAKHASAKNKVFSMNLSAPFISQFFKDRLDSVLPFIDILFGNESEAKAFSEAHGFGLTDETEIAKKIVSLPKVNKQRPRMVIITQGQGPVIVAQESGVQTFPVTILAQEKIVDTNGAGDAFVGGFLAQHVQGKGLAECVKCGIWTATEIIQQPGCTFPKDREYK